MGYARADGVTGDYQRITNNRDVVITLGQVENELKNVPYNQVAVGLYHIALLAESKAQVDRLASHISNLGIELVPPGVDFMDYKGGYYSFAFRDPDGIEIEITYHGSQYFDATEEAS